MNLIRSWMRAQDPKGSFYGLDLCTTGSSPLFDITHLGVIFVASLVSKALVKVSRLSDSSHRVPPC